MNKCLEKVSELMLVVLTVAVLVAAVGFCVWIVCLWTVYIQSIAESLAKIAEAM